MKYRKQVQRNVELFASSIIEGTKEKLTVDAASKMLTMADNMEAMYKPEMVDVIAKHNGLMDKYFTIPKDVQIAGYSRCLELNGLDDVEKEHLERQALLEKTILQQHVMMTSLLQENELYDSVIAEIASDAELSNFVENNFSIDAINDSVANSASTSAIGTTFGAANATEKLNNSLPIGEEDAVELLKSLKIAEPSDDDSIIFVSETAGQSKPTNNDQIA